MSTGPLNSGRPTTSVIAGAVFNKTQPTPGDQQAMALQVDNEGNLLVNVAVGGGSGGSNPAAGPTGSPVPVDADYIGVNIAGNLVGVTGFSLTNVKAEAVAIVDASGNQITSFGGGTQFADNSASGATPTGTLSMGWDSVNSKIRALKVDASQNLFVAVNAALPAGTNVIGHVITDSGSTTAVTGTVAVNHTQTAGSTLGAITNYGTSPGAVLVESVNAFITNTPAVTLASTTVTNTVAENLTQWASTVLGAPTNFGTTPGAVIVGSVNASLFSGTTGLTNTSGALDINIKSSGATVTVAGTITANQGGAPWSQNLTQLNSVALGSPSAYGTSPGAVNVLGVNAFITNAPTVTANAGTGNFSVVGTLTNNNAVPGANNVGVLPAIANAAAPAYTEGDQVLLSTDLTGTLRTSAMISAGSNMAKETGGNLAAVATQTLNAGQIPELLQFVIARLDAINLTLASMADIHINPDDIMQVAT